jgi:hypothetical protein
MPATLVALASMASVFETPVSRDGNFPVLFSIVRLACNEQKVRIYKVMFSDIA